MMCSAIRHQLSLLAPSEIRLLSPRGRTSPTMNFQPAPSRHGRWRHSARRSRSRPLKLGAAESTPSSSSEALCGT
eukprot:2893332-Pleurochrysis_carterae.AAC.4